MNTADLTKAVAAATGISQSDTKAAVIAVFDELASAAARGEDVSIGGFGKFTVKSRAEREGRNPKTGEALTIAASRKLSFAAAKGLKDKL